MLNFVSYLSDINQVKLIKGVKEGISTLKDLGHKIYLHTNQSGISSGYFNFNKVVECNNEMIDLIGLGPHVFEEICIASDFPQKKNSYRKPSPKFGNEIIKKTKIDKNLLIYVGDNITDIETAKNIGCRAIGVNYGLSNLQKIINERKDIDFLTFNSFSEVIEEIIKVQ